MWEIASDCTDYPSYLTAGHPTCFQTFFIASPGTSDQLAIHRRVLRPPCWVQFIAESGSQSSRETCPCRLPVWCGCDSGKESNERDGPGCGQGRRVSVSSQPVPLSPVMTLLNQTCSKPYLLGFNGTSLHKPRVIKII